MNLIILGILAGLAAAPVWFVMNLFTDFFFMPVIQRNADMLNATLLSRPGLNLLVLAADITIWSAVFGAGYGLFYPGIAHFGPVGGILWGMFMFIAFSRSMIESTIWTKVPRAANVFWFVEGLVGLISWGAMLGFVFSRLV